MKWIFGAITIILAMSMLVTAAPENDALKRMLAEHPIFRMRRRGSNPYDNSVTRTNNAAAGPVPDPQPVTEAVAGTPQTPSAPRTPGVPA